MHRKRRDSDPRGKISSLAKLLWRKTITRFEAREKPVSPSRRPFEHLVAHNQFIHNPPVINCTTGDPDPSAAPNADIDLVMLMKRFALQLGASKLSAK